MGFLVFLFTAFFSGGAMENPGGGLVFGILSWIVYSQGKRINALEKGHVPVVAPQEPAPIKAEARPLPSQSVPVSAERISETDPTPPVPPTPIAAPVLPKAPPGPPSPLVAFFTTGNPIARIGAVILFFGVAFSLKLAADEGYFPPEVRLLAAAIGSIAFLIGGWKLRARKKQFALTLQGTGVGIFYITTYIAYKMYHMIPSTLTFGFFVVITILSGVLAVAGNSRSIAVLAMIGGFLAPVLASEGGGSHVALFGYITLLNLGIFAMCWFRSWRALNATGFLFTFFISASWAGSFYEPTMYQSCQFFLILFALLYTGINILYTLKQTEDPKGNVDTLMTFGTPLLYSLLQWHLVDRFPYGSAISAASFGACHIIVAKALHTRYGQKVRNLVESYLTVGLILLTLAVPFTFDGRVSSAIWALEAAALIWNGIRQNRLMTRVLGILLLPLSAVLFLGDHSTSYSDMAFLNQYFIGVLLIAAGHLVSGALLVRAPDGSVRADEKTLGKAALFLGCTWWGLGGGYEIGRHLYRWQGWWANKVHSDILVNSSSFEPAMYSLFATVSIFVFCLLFDRFKLPGKIRLHQLLLPLNIWLVALFFGDAFFSVYYREQDTHLLTIPGILSWPLLFVAHYATLYRHEKADSQYSPRWQHQIALWFLLCIATWEARWYAEFYAAIGWGEAALILVPSLLVVYLCSQLKKNASWPFNRHTALYASALWLPVWWSLGVSFLFDFTSSCPTAPLPYIPLLNVLDIAQAASVIALILWMRRLSALGMLSASKETSTYSMLGAWSFVWATSTLLRTIHHTMGVPWNFDAMFDSNFVQASLSIFWTVLALTLMLLSHSKGWRQLWKTGAILIAIVVVKLFIVDLASQGTVGRIAAFLGVGALMLSIGYLAPIPPEKKSEAV